MCGQGEAWLQLLHQTAIARVLLLIMWYTDHDGCVDAFACQGVNVSCSIADNDKVVIKGCSQPLTPKAQTCGLHALYFGIGAQCLADERVILDCALMQALEIALLYSSKFEVKTSLTSALMDQSIANQSGSWLSPLVQQQAF